MTAAAITAHHPTTATASAPAPAAPLLPAAPAAPATPARFVEAREQIGAVRDLLARAGSERREVRDEELLARRPELLALFERLARLQGRGGAYGAVRFGPEIEALFGRLYGLEPDIAAGSH